MSPHISFTHLRAELQTRLEACSPDDHFTRALITDKIQTPNMKSHTAYRVCENKATGEVWHEYQGNRVQGSLQYA